MEQFIKQKPFLQEALSKGIINQAALAEELRPQLEKELHQKVKFSAVNMAIRRLGEKLEHSPIAKVKFDAKSDLTLKSNLVEITVFKMNDVQDYLRQLYHLVDFRKGDFLTITQGLYEVMIITNQEYLPEILKLFPQKSVKKIIKNLSSITINIPASAVGTVGLFYLVTRALNWENINVVDIVSTYTEMTFIVSEQEAARSFQLLSELIKQDR